VVEFLEREQAVGEFLDHVFALVGRSVDNYRTRNFTDLYVAFGCTGGQHRSVYCAERLAGHLRARCAVEVEVRHLAQEGAAPAPDTLTPSPLPGGEGRRDT
jgi:RNase adaptor protein for sRNA GlmZ degradation